MSNKLIPNPKDPNQSADYIYGERMEPLEERMNFFLDEKVKVDKSKVKDEDKDAVDGLESIIERFSSYGKKELPLNNDIPSEPYVDGVESASNVKRLINFLIQLAKDAVDFIMNLVNNRIARIDAREYRVSLNRKRNGILSDPVKYPAVVRRLLQPHRVSTDPNWITFVLKDVNDFYDDTIKAYKSLTKEISTVAGIDIDLKSKVSDSIAEVARIMHMSKSGDGYTTEILPGNKHFVINEPTAEDPDKVAIFVQFAAVDSKLKSPDYQPSGVMFDDTLKVIKGLLRDVRSNQSTVSQLYRTFEKEGRKQESENRLSPNQRAYLNWLIRFNKKLMTLSIQYVLTALDTGLDFVNSGLRHDS